MSQKIIIEIDDEDRDDVPDKPWTANVKNENDEPINQAAGIGATPEAAVRDLFDTARQDDEEWVRIL